jgi:tRNA-specific 2-thiouridylase
MLRSVLLGFSGGIDSSAAVEELRQSGYRVVALTLDTTGDENMVATARKQAAQLSVEHYVKDVRADFQQKIIDYFISSYASGRTPAPCTMCNPLIKWHHLLLEADRLGIDYIATGHYFNVEECDGRYYVARALDSRKDQSYYLWGLSQEVLRRVVTPMGQKIKSDINPPHARSKESMGLCFLRGVGYGDFIAHNCPKALKRGEVVNTLGEVVGTHDGIALYTIGQKRGVVGGAVVGIDAKSNCLIVGENRDLYKATLEVGACNIVSEDELLSSPDVQVVVRGFGRNPEGFAKLIEPIGGGYRIALDDPAWAPAAGQPVVFYRGNRVLGGGILERYY